MCNLGDKDDALRHGNVISYDSVSFVVFVCEYFYIEDLGSWLYKTFD